MGNKRKINRKKILDIEDIFNFVKNSRQRIVISFIALMIVLYFATHFKKIFFIALLSLIGSFSLLYVRFVPEAYVLGVELVIFSTIITGYSYGAIAGLIVGLITIFISQAITGRFKLSTFISIIICPLIGLAAHYLNFLPINQAGIVLVIAYDILILPLYYISGSRITTLIVYFSTHLLFNAWLFTDIAPIVLRIM
ncbi:MAG: hypothetical protein KKF44_03485 [Nanoarchaeota archaeon]|nr:hypothetical protein [Nanoarchaeota archaeon]